MARTIKRGDKLFANLYTDLILPTSTIRLCTDEDLVTRREEAQAELDAAKIGSRGQTREASMSEDPGDDNVREAQARLDEIDEQIDASDKTTILEVSAPSEAAMLSVQKYYDDDDVRLWQRHILALCLQQPVAEVEKLQEHITRGTWVHLVQQATELVMGGVAALPTRRAGSESSPASSVFSAPPEPGD